MPLVTVTLRKGRSPEFLTQVGDAIQAALAKANVPEADRFQIFHEVEDHQLYADPNFAGNDRVERSKDVMFIQIILNTGRTDEIKSTLYAYLARGLGETGVRPDDVFINLVEVMKQNWSMALGKMTYPA